MTIHISNKWAKSQFTILLFFTTITFFSTSFDAYSQTGVCTSFGRPMASVDFGSGTARYNTANLGFTTSFGIWNKAQTNDGTYSIVNSIPADFRVQNRNVWLSGFDHTSGDGTGYMMLVNADANRGTFYKATVNNLCVGGTYEFSSYMANIFQRADFFPIPENSIPPEVRFEIRELNGNLLDFIETGPIATTSTLTWKQYGLTFTATSSSIQLIMISTAPQGQGNDIVLDDIAFRPCVPVVAFAEPEKNVCENDNTSFKVNVVGNSTYSYSRWQISKDNGATWIFFGQDIVQTPPSPDYTVTLPLNNVSRAENNNMYRLVVSTSSSNLSIPNSPCNVISDTSILRVNAYPVLKTTDPGTSCNAAVDITAPAILTGSVLNSGALSYYRNGTDAANGTNAMTTADAQSITSSGTYFIRAATSNPVCADVDTVNVVIDNPQSITLSGPSPLCKDNPSFTVTATTQGVNNLIWTKSSSNVPLQTGSSKSLPVTPTASDLALDSIWIKAVPNDGSSTCPGVKDSVKVLFYTPALVALPKDTTFCANTPSLNLSVQAKVTGIPTGIVWSTIPNIAAPSPATGNGTQLNLSNLSIPLFLYATATNTGCIPRKDSMKIEFEAVPVVNAGADTLLCAGKPFSRSAIFNANWKYNWSVVDDGTMTNPASSTRTLHFIPKGPSVYVELTVSTKAGCTDEDDFSISVTKPPVITLPEHECIAPSLALRPVLDFTPTLGSFSWLKDGNVFAGSATANSLPVSSTGRYTLKYTYGSCVTADSTLVTALPVLNSQDTTACEGKNVTLTAPFFKKATYSWDNAPFTSSNTHNVLSTNQAITVTFLVRDSLGCESDTFSVVRGAPIPEFSLAVTNVCEGEKGRIDATLKDPNLKGLFIIGSDWKKEGNSLTYTTFDSLEVSTSGKYQLKLFIGNCEVTKETTVSLYSPPLIPAQDKYVYCNEDPESVVLSSQSEEKQSWYHGNTFLGTGPTLAVHPDSNATYTLNVESVHGCKSCKPIYVELCCAPRLFVPNVITPSSSDQNSKLDIFGKYYTNFEINVFSRWGEIIFSSKDPSVTWDGNYRSEAMPIGVYAWRVTYEGVCPDYKGPYKKVGEVTVVR